MTKYRAPPRRVDVEHFINAVSNATEAELEARNELDHANYEAEYQAFSAAYEREECYLCGLPFKVIKSDSPCVHWLLRRGKFKKHDLPKIYEAFGFTQIAAFTRWCANQEKFLGNINDFKEQKDSRKIFEFTVKWKNIEWTFDCSKTDYEGHKGTHSNFPHYHLQMRIDGRSFIGFNDFHLQLSEDDLLRLDIQNQASEYAHVSFGPAGDGMQLATEIDTLELIENMTVAEDESDASFRMQTIIHMGKGSIDGKKLLKIVKESQRTGETIASLAGKHFGKNNSIKTVVMPSDSVPEIAKRSERSRR